MSMVYMLQKSLIINKGLHFVLVKIYFAEVMVISNDTTTSIWIIGEQSLEMFQMYFIVAQLDIFLIIDYSESCPIVQRMLFFWSYIWLQH